MNELFNLFNKLAGELPYPIELYQEMKKFLDETLFGMAGNYIKKSAIKLSNTIKDQIPNYDAILQEIEQLVKNKEINKQYKINYIDEYNYLNDCLTNLIIKEATFSFKRDGEFIECVIYLDDTKYYDQKTDNFEDFLLVVKSILDALNINKQRAVNCLKNTFKLYNYYLAKSNKIELFNESLHGTFFYYKNFRLSLHLQKFSGQNSGKFIPNHHIIFIYFDDEDLFDSYNLEKFEHIIKEKENTLRHELRHFVQFTKSQEFNHWYGLPFKTKNKDLKPEHVNQNQIHQLRDVEFYTNLSDCIDEFKQTINNFPKILWRECYLFSTNQITARQFSGLIKSKLDKNLFFKHYDEIIDNLNNYFGQCRKNFELLYSNDIDKYKKAIKIFHSAIESYANK